MVVLWTAGIAWQKVNTQSNSVIHQKSLKVVIVIHLIYENSYHVVIIFFCAKYKNPPKNTMSTTTIRMHSQRAKPAEREGRLTVSQLSFGH